MKLGAIHQALARVRERLLMGTVEKVPEWNQTCEFDCRATACDWEKWKVCKRRLEAPCEIHGQVAASFAPTQHRADTPDGACEQANKCVSASDVAREVLGGNSSANISNVLVLGTEGSTPLKRMEIHLEDPKQVPATLRLLAAALKDSGLDFHAAPNPGVPATEIWLTSPLHNGKKALLSCAAPIEQQVLQRVAV